MHPFSSDEKKAAEKSAEKKSEDKAPPADAQTVTSAPASDRNKGESKTKPYDWPRYVFKRGTGRLVNEEKGQYEAETRLVHDEDEFARLGDGWLNTPKEATMSVNVTNANARILYNEDGSVAVEPKGAGNTPDSSGDFHRRTMIDADETLKPHLEKK
jgi:hypothetical protein